MKKLAVIAAAASLLALSACDSIREAAGLTKVPPDEFAVSTKAPLVVPPDYNLRPPQPGAAPITKTDPDVAAQQAMFSNADPQTIAAGMSGNFTPGEKMLLANARVQTADPAIRAELQSENNQQGADQSFTDRILGPAPPPQKTPSSRLASR